MSKIFNITFITNSIGFGGASKMLRFVATELAKRGHNVSIINRNSIYRNNNKSMPVSSEITYYSIKENSRFSEIKKILEIAKSEKSDVLIGFTEEPNMYAKIVGTLLNIPSIMSERGDPERTNGRRGWKNKIVMSIIDKSKGAVFQTEGASKFYAKGLQKRGMIIPNPIFIAGDISNVLQTEREKTVVSVSRFDNSQKRYDVMLKAFKIFSETHPEYILKLYGKGPDEEQIKTWVKELDIEDKVKFMGLTLSPMQDICRDGMFIITSDYEGIPNALLEAMATGLPCVATDCTPGGARLLIQDHQNGLLAPIGDYEKVAKALGEFADNPELAASCGEKAKDVINRFAPSRIIDMWENYISNILK